MQDITDWYDRVCQDLPTGSMVKPSDLSMLDAMNAIQIMDPKMDTGALQSNVSMSQFVFSPEASMSPEDICCIMDIMMALEMAWYRGATLCQSVYTSLLYHNPQHLAQPVEWSASETSQLVNVVLRGYVLLYCKTIDLAYSEFAKGNVRDGEDCWLDHYGIPVRMSDPVNDVISLADDALNWLEGDGCQVSSQWRQQLISRMIVRRISISPSSILRVIRIAADNITVSSMPSNAAKAAFDNAIPSYLRQHMPLPSIDQPNSTETLHEMRQLVDTLISIEAIEEEGSWERWQTRFDLACDRLIHDRHWIDNVVRSTIFYETGSSEAAVLAFDGASDTDLLAVNRQVGAWKNLISSEFWWWMQQVTQSRIRYTPLSSTWPALWAKIWVALSSAMSMARSGLTPRFQNFIEAQKTLNQETSLDLAVAKLAEAVEWLDVVLAKKSETGFRLEDFFSRAQRRSRWIPRIQ
ncbi:uncharacterized protein L201_007764 [Kwoniella dendrophila CBS 6074]|uniref:NAA35-like N-terminal domain-containing protein n=1 Tax=Kwoniella dendrophila CBS 6074 TaxID=1295534 RepID=A0AAX4K7K5_9TREE